MGGKEGGLFRQFFLEENIYSEKNRGMILFFKFISKLFQSLCWNLTWLDLEFHYFLKMPIFYCLATTFSYQTMIRLRIEICLLLVWLGLVHQ